MKVFWYLEFETIVLTFQDGVGGFVAEYMIEPAQYLVRITVSYNHVMSHEFNNVQYYVSKCYQYMSPRQLPHRLRDLLHGNHNSLNMYNYVSYGVFDLSMHSHILYVPR